MKQAAPGNSEVEDGHFTVPTDEEVVRAHPMRDLHFDLFAEDRHFRQAAR